MDRNYESSVYPKTQVIMLYMDENELAFRTTFRRTLSCAKHLVMTSIPATDAGLCKLMAFALHSNTPSGYPFVLRYSFCRRERDGDKVLKVAAAVHLLQQSSVITDDIFDSGEVRYGRRPVYLNYDVNYGIIAAELLQTVALRCVSEELAKGYFCNTGIAFKLLNQLLLDGYVGQYLDLFNTAQLSMSRKEYYRVIALGAGRVFQNIARCGALLAGKPAEEVHVLSRFAYAYGMALFIIDDIIDMLAAKATGKTYASDLKRRRMRLPIIMALRLCDRSQRKVLDRFLRKGATDETTIPQVVTVIRDSGALKASFFMANQYLATSLRSLAKLPPSITTERFHWLVERLLLCQHN